MVYYFSIITIQYIWSIKRLMIFQNKRVGKLIQLPSPTSDTSSSYHLTTA